MSSEIKTNPIADPGPLGLAAFALTTFVLSMVNAKLVPSTIGPIFMTLALFYGGTAQVLAGMWEFKKNNIFGATAFTSYGAFWLALGSLVLFEHLKVIDFGADRSTAVGLFLVAWTIFTFYMWLGSFRLNKALIAIFTTLLAAFILLDLAEFGFISSVPGGILGLICAACAWYTSAAGILNTVSGKEVLPVGAIKPAQQKMAGIGAGHGQ